MAMATTIGAHQVDAAVNASQSRCRVFLVVPASKSAAQSGFRGVALHDAFVDNRQMEARLERRVSLWRQQNTRAQSFLCTFLI